VTGLQKEITDSERKNSVRAQELEIEAQITALKSTGDKRVMDEINLRQRLLTLKIAEAQAQEKMLRGAGYNQEADAKKNEIGDLKNQYGANEIRKSDLDQNKEQRIASLRTDLEKQAFERLSKEEKIEALKRERIKLEMDMISSDEEKALKAEKRAGEIQDQIQALTSQKKKDTITADSLRRIGGGFARVNYDVLGAVANNDAKKQTGLQEKMVKSLQILEAKETGLSAASFSGFAWVDAMRYCVWLFKTSAGSLLEGQHSGRLKQRKRR